MINIIVITLVLFSAVVYFFQGEEGAYQGTVIVKENFTCKNKEFISDKPIRVYRFYQDNSLQTALLPYYAEPINYHKIPKKDKLDYDYTVKLYPSFTKYKIGKIYGSCSFSAGCFDNFLLEAEDGLKMWISAMNMDIDNCILKSEFDYEITTTVDDRNATTRHATMEVDAVIQRPPMYITDYWKDLKYIKAFSKEHNTTRGGKEVSLEVSIGDQYNELYYLHYTRNILEKYFPKDFNGSINIKLVKHKRPPTFSYGETSLHPYSCKEAISDPYACFHHLDKWLESPYRMKSYFSEFEQQENILKKLTKDKKYILIKLSWGKIDFNKFKLLPKQIDTIYELLGKKVAIAIQFNDKKQEGIYVKDKVKTYEHIHLMSQKKFMKALLKYHYLDSNNT